MTDMPAEDARTNNIWRMFVLRERLTLTIGSVIAALLMLWLANLLDLPDTTGRAGSVLQQPAWALGLLLAWIGLIAASLLAAGVASHLHYEGGLFCGCVALAALSVRHGPMRFALFSADSPAVFLLFALELLLLYAAVFATWTLLRAASKGGLLAPEPTLTREPDEPLDQKLLATAAHAIASMVVMLLLCHNDDKAQVIASVAIASYLASLAAHHFIPTHPSGWYIAGPMLAGMAGYVVQYFSPTDWMIGDARGFFAALARPLPLDYAAMGPAGALLGYWTSRRWLANQDVED